MRRILILFLIVILIPIRIKGEELDLAKNAKSAIMLEASTGEIIFKKNESEKQSPASMTKMMTMLLVLESIEKGIINWNDKITVSNNASSMGGSQILLEENEVMSVDDLFKGVAIASGNDAAVALAEKIAGSTSIFVNMMNKRAKELGLSNTNFKNVHGLDEEGHYSTAYDMAMIAKELVKHKKVLEYSKIYEDYLRKGTDRELWLVNTNKLVRFYNGVDGLKTGYTETAGYCLTATALKNNMRIIAVVMGELESKIRNGEVTEMLDYAFAQYELDVILTKDSIVDSVEVKNAKKEIASITPLEDVTILRKKTEEKNIPKYEIDIHKLEAPLKSKDIVGNLYLKDNNDIERIIPLTINEDINRANIFELYLRNLKKIILGNI